MHVGVGSPPSRLKANLTIIHSSISQTAFAPSVFKSIILRKMHLLQGGKQVHFAQNAFASLGPVPSEANASLGPVGPRPRQVKVTVLTGPASAPGQGPAAAATAEPRPRSRDRAATAATATATAIGVMGAAQAHK